MLLNTPIFLLWIRVSMHVHDRHFGSHKIFLHLYSGPCIPEKEQHRLRGGILWPVCLSWGSNGDHLFLSHHRCLEDNQWNYIRAGQVFTMLQVRPGDQVGERWMSLGLQEGGGQVAWEWNSGHLPLLTSWLLPSRTKGRYQRRPSTDALKGALGCHPPLHLHHSFLSPT